MYLPLLNSLFKFIQKGRRPERVLYYPSKISIETGNVCNLRCPLCPTNDAEYAGIKKGFMSFEDFRIVFDKIAPFVKTIDLFSWGEPFLNNSVGKMIRYAKNRKPSLRIFVDSNLNVVDEGHVSEIVTAGLDVLKVSCDGATQRVYEEYRRGGDLARVMENIRRIEKKKKELGKSVPKVIWKYLVFSHNVGEVEKARKEAVRLGVGFEASGMRTDCGREIFEKVEEAVKRDGKWIPRGSEYDNYRDLSAGKFFCEKPWRTLTVNWDGEVVPCGAIYDVARHTFGNLLKQSFDDVWNGEKFRVARRVINGDFSGDCPVLKGTVPAEVPVLKGTVPVEVPAGVICAECRKNGYQFF